MDQNEYMDASQCFYHGIINNQNNEAVCCSINHENNNANPICNNYGSYYTFQIPSVPDLYNHNVENRIEVFSNVDVKNLDFNNQSQTSSNAFNGTHYFEMFNYQYPNSSTPLKDPVMIKSNSNVGNNKSFTNSIQFNSKKLKSISLEKKKLTKPKNIIQVMGRKRVSKLIKQSNSKINKSFESGKQKTSISTPTLKSPENKLENFLCTNSSYMKDMEDIDVVKCVGVNDESHKESQSQMLECNKPLKKRIVWYDDADIIESNTFTKDINERVATLDNDEMNDKIQMYDINMSAELQDETMEETKDFDQQETLSSFPVYKRIYRCIPKIFLPMERFSNSEDSDDSDIDVTKD